jgi:hypothetical protein
MVATTMPTGITATGMEAFGMVDTGTRGIGILAPCRRGAVLMVRNVVEQPR